MAKVSINSMGCAVEVEDDNASARALMKLAICAHETARDQKWNDTHAAVGFQAQVAVHQPRPYQDTGLDASPRYVPRY